MPDDRAQEPAARVAGIAHRHPCVGLAVAVVRDGEASAPTVRVVFSGPAGGPVDALHLDLGPLTLTRAPGRRIGPAPPRESRAVKDPAGAPPLERSAS